MSQAFIKEIDDTGYYIIQSLPIIMLQFYCILLLSFPLLQGIGRTDGTAGF